MIRAAAIGECMIELTHRDARSLALGFGGDTLNTALYLARCAPAARLAVDYLTALGTDPYSDMMVAAWAEERIGTARVVRLPGKMPGLYIIRTDDSGERRFFYWRSEAAARALFRDKATMPILDALPDYDAVYFSGVTLAILAPEAREALASALGRARGKGRLVAFDSNIRQSLWPDRAAAQVVFRRFLPLASLALPTFDDEQSLFGDTNPEATLQRYASAGTPEIVVKQGATGCLLRAGGKTAAVAIPAPVAAVDTTAAGDGFNAGYIAARLTGAEPETAARAGHRLASAVIQHPGAIIPRAATPSFAELMAEPSA